MKSQTLIILAALIGLSTAPFMMVSDVHRLSPEVGEERIAQLEQKILELEDKIDNKTYKVLRRNIRNIKETRLVFDMKSFIDDLTGAHHRVYYLKGQQIGDLKSFLPFVRKRVYLYSYGRSRSFLAKNKYLYYDLMLALIIYGNKKYDTKSSWNNLSLDPSNPVFKSIVASYRLALGAARAQYLFTMFNGIHSHSTGGEKLVFKF